jgi:hypothetical protein
MHFAIPPEELCARNGVELVWRFWNAACVEVGARSICFRMGIIGRVAQYRRTILCVLPCQREVREMQEMERALDEYEKSRRRMKSQMRRLLPDQVVDRGIKRSLLA